MFSHVVLYKTNPSNPQAAEMIVTMAKRLLCAIFSPGVATFHAAKIPPSDRSVGGNEFQVILNFVFKNRAQYEMYMGHPLHLAFVRFVLRGWMIKDSRAADPEDEFIGHILYAGPNAPAIEWARNPAIPENEVVWAGEEVYDAY